MNIKQDSTIFNSGKKKNEPTGKNLLRSMDADKKQPEGIETEQYLGGTTSLPCKRMAAVDSDYPEFPGNRRFLVRCSAPISSNVWKQALNREPFLQSF